MGVGRRLAVGVISAGVGGLAAWQVFRVAPRSLSRDELMAEARAGGIRAVRVVDQEVITGESVRYGAFRSDFDREADRDLLGELRALGVAVKFERSGLGLI